MNPKGKDARVSESISDNLSDSSGEVRGAQPPARHIWWKVLIVLVLVAAVAVIIAAKKRAQTPPSKQDQSTGAFDEVQKEGEYAPDTVLATVNGEKITHGDLDQMFREIPAQNRAVFEHNRHELLEQIILRELLLQKARASNIADTQAYRDGMGSHADHPGHEEHVLIDVLLQHEVLQDIKVTEEDLLHSFGELEDALPDQTSFEDVREDLQRYVLQEKQNMAFESYRDQLRTEAAVTYNEDWVEAQKALAADNPLDRALATGRPVVADFGQNSCTPCKMMKPILDALKEEYDGRAEILIIETDQYPAVTQRVGIRAIPTQIFYDADGNEIDRHQGFMSREAIVKKLKEMGVE